MLNRCPSRRVLGIVVLSTLASGLAVVLPAAAGAAGPSTVTQTFSYTGSTATFTVPAGITQLTLSAKGGEGGRGGTDASGPSPLGGYQGVVTGTIAVTPGQVLTIAVGSGGASGNGGAGANNPTTYATQGVALGGTNPLGSYGGGNGGAAGWQGSSGFGGAGGAATVITTNGTTIVAGGGGGAGGSGQYAPLVGRVGPSTFTARSDTTSTNGQIGISVYIACQAPGSISCDGGGGGAGGGGAQGGVHGDVQFGSGSYTEWYGYGGSPGQNSTGGLDGLTAAYQYYADDSANGSVTVSYDTGAPAAPTALVGAPRDSAVALGWTAPASTGGAPITDYIVEYATAADPTHWTTADDGVSADPQALVPGLTDDTAYVFRVTAVNSFGNGVTSANSDPITPVGPPAAPVISSVTPSDAALSVAFAPAASGSPVTDYEYQVDGGAWVSAGSTTSPLTISGLTNGTSYDVAIRAVSAIGDGAASAPVTATPQAPPGAPSISSISTVPGTATVAFVPGYDGGSPITDYEYSLNGGAWTSAGTTTSPVTIPGLATGTTYTISLRSVTASGTSAASPASTVTMPDVPAAPSVTAVTPADGSLTVAFAAGNSGGSPITGYEYQLTAGGPWTAVPAQASPFVVTGLTDGAGYPVRVRATNVVGTGPASAAVTGTPATVPGAPAIVGNTVAGADGKLSAAFTAPAWDGGSPITTYQYSTDGGATWRVRDAGTTASPLVISTLSSDGITPLVHGAQYSVEIRAVNAMGAGVASAVATGIAVGTPAAPTISSVTALPSALRVSFEAGSNGGAAVTRYEYRVGGGAWTDTGSLGNEFVVPGLTNGTTYGVQVRAVNNQGAGDPSATVNGTPVTTPGQATIDGVVRGDHTLTVSVGVPSTGGSPVTGWQYSTDGGTTWASAGAAASPLTITALSADGVTPIANGTSYPVAVRAVNVAGAGAASAVTNVGPAATPSAPAVALTALNQAVQVAYTLPSDGGAPVSAVQYRVNGGAWIDAGTLTSPFVIGGLDNGTAYAVQVRAVNAIGAGGASTPASATPFTVPGSPNLVTAVSDTASADVSWAAPDTDGGSAVTGYTATAYTSSTGATTAGSCTTAGLACSITGLTNGATYYVSVVAANAAGTGLASAPRVQVVPLARPAAPTISSLTAGNSLLTLAFTAGSAGSSPITGYQYQLNGGAWVTASGTSSPITISGLANGTAYTVALRAVSAAGVGVASATRTATPYTYPDAPAGITANGVNGAVVVSWTAPNNNGSAITGYTATAFNALTAGSQVGTCTTTGALTCTISGLTNGVTYYISMQATNAAGLSVRSDPRVPATPSLYPGAVANLTAVASDGQVGLTWTPGSTGASAITDYTVWYSTDGTNFTQFADGVSTTAAATVTGLTDGTPYWFKVYAVNASGTGPASAPTGPVTPLAPGIVPTATVPVRAADGFSFDIANYAAGTTYAVTATNGATVTRSGSTVTVSGLGAGASSTVTVTASTPTTTTTTLDVTGSALSAGIAPTFTVPVRTVDGYAFAISNYVPSALYTVSATGGAQVDRYGDQLVVSGLAAGATADVTVSVARTGFTDASAVQSGAALAAGTAPTFADLSRTADGFTFTIANYTPGLVYSLGATGGATVTRVGPTVIVSGLAAGGSADVTVTATDPGNATASATESGTALLAGTAPTLSAPTTLDGGFFLAVENFDAAFAYTATATGGASAVVQPDGTVLVSGLAPGASSTVTVTASRAGYADASADATGTSLAAGVAPVLSAAKATVDGFTFAITNYDPTVTYTATVAAGASVVLTGDHGVVNGLAAGNGATVTVTASAAGHLDASSDLTGNALAAGTAPRLSRPTGTAGGYTFTITDYDPAATYALVVTGAATVTRNGAQVTVSGLAPGHAADVTVTVSRAGATAAAAVETGAALAAEVSPSVSAPVGSAEVPARTSAGAAPSATSAQNPPAPRSDRRDVPPGEVLVLVDGKPVQALLSATATRLVLSAGGLGLQLAGLDGGHEAALGADGIVHVDRGGDLRLWLSGFGPGSTASVALFSQEQHVATVQIQADGHGVASFTLPPSVQPGDHTLVVDGTTADGHPASMSVGIVVNDRTRAAALVRPSGHHSDEWIWYVVAAALVTAVGGVLVLGWRRRRDEGEGEPGLA